MEFVATLPGNGVIPTTSLLALIIYLFIFYSCHSAKWLWTYNSNTIKQGSPTGVAGGGKDRGCSVQATDVCTRTAPFTQAAGVYTRHSCKWSFLRESARLPLVRPGPKWATAQGVWDSCYKIIKTKKPIKTSQPANTKAKKTRPLTYSKSRPMYPAKFLKP